MCSTCQQCETNHALKEGNSFNCYDKNTPGYYYDPSGGKLKKYYDTCESCSSKGTGTFNNCEECLADINGAPLQSRYETNPGKFNCGTKTCKELSLFNKAVNSIDCTRSCPNSNNACVDGCGTNQKKYKEKQLCVDFCQEHSAFQDWDKKECKSTFNEYIFFDVNEAVCKEYCEPLKKLETSTPKYFVKECPENKTHIDGNECQENCGDKYEFPVDLSLIYCVKHCTNSYPYSYIEKRCVDKCENSYLDTTNNQCVAQCDDDLYSSDDKFCYRRSPDDLYTDSTQKQMQFILLRR